MSETAADRDPRQAAEALRRTVSAGAQHLKFIFDHVAEGILVQDREFRCVFVNELGARMSGFPTAEAFMKHSVTQVIDRFELLDEEGNPFPLEELPARQALRGVAEPRDVTVLVRELDTGNETWSMISARPVPGASGLPELAISIFRDVTAQKRSEDRLRFLTEASKTLFSSLDYNETLKTVAALAVPHFADWCTFAVVEETGPRHVAVAHPDPEMLKRAEEMQRECPTDWSAPRGVGNVIRTGASELYPEITDGMLASSIRDPLRLRITREIGLRSVIVVPIAARGRSLGALTLISTRPGRRYSEEDLSFAEELGRRAGLAVDNARLFSEAKSAIRVRDEFLSIASHELKTPITSLKLQTQMARKRVDRADSVSEDLRAFSKFIESADRQITRLTRLVDDMLDISRIAHGKLTLSHERFDLGLLVRDVVDRFSEQMKVAGCRYRVSFDGEIEGEWDRYRIEQVVTNLVTNAIKYGAGNPIEISVLSECSSAVIKVADRGIGIAPENQERIFQRFERAIDSRSIAGLGLGLYITKQIVEAHGGRILVESALGQGSAFRVELPLEATPASGGEAR